MGLKQKIYDHYLRFINDKVVMLQQLLADLKESSSNETKSTAGDKHETALAMLQIEQANTRVQLQEALAQKTVLDKIDPSLRTIVIVKGSLIKTNRGLLFMSIAAGKAVIDNIPVMALSPHSPLGKMLMGLKVGERAVINSMEYILESID